MNFYSNSLSFFWKFLNSRSVEDVNRLIYLAVLVCLVVFCYYTNPLVCLFVFISTTLPGAVFTHFYFSGKLLNYFRRETNRIPISQFNPKSVPEELQHLSSQKSDSLNETDHHVESELDRTISHFSETIVNNFISEWYSSLVSDNPELPDKSYPLIDLALSNLCDRAQSLPLSQLSSHLLLHGLIPHFSSLQRAILDTNSPLSVSTHSLLERIQLPRTVHNFEACEHAHPALRNQPATHMYAEHIFDLLLQASYLPSSLKDSFIFRSVLRDVISTSFLLKLFDIVSKPHFIYKCITFVFSLQFPSDNSKPTGSTRNTTTLKRQYSGDVIDSELAPVCMRNVKSMGRKSKCYDIPDRLSRYQGRKHSNTTQQHTDINSILRERREVPLSANQNFISIFAHELVQDSLTYSYYLYSIRVPEVITNRFNQSEACIVKHRFREFEQLYRLLQNKYKELMRGISFPSKLSQIRIGSLTNEFIMRRRMLLERFLKSMCMRDQLLQSPEIQIFLGISSPKRHELNRQSTCSRLSRTLNTSELGTTQNVEDVVLKLRVFVTKQLLSSADASDSLLSPTQTLDATEYNASDAVQNADNTSPEITCKTDTEDSIPLKPHSDKEKELLSLTRQMCRVTLDILNGADVDTVTRAGELMEEFPFTSSLYLFGVTALRNKQLWINTETFLILLLEMLGESSTRTLQGKMDELNTDKRLSAYFEMLERKFFPEGKLTPVSSNPVTQGELEQTKSAACDAIFNFLPDLIESVAGESELRRTISYCLDCLSNQAINRHLLLRLFDIILLYLVPELTEDTFQQSLGIQHSNPQIPQY